MVVYYLFSLVQCIPVYTIDHGSLEDTTECDVVIVPGGKGVWPLQCDAEFLGYIQRLAASAQWICSVCTGSFLLAAAGLLTDRRCTTYHAYLDKLRATKLTGPVLDNQRFVADGNRLTAAGVSAGIDMSLWLVKELEGEAFAREVKQYIEYFPESPV